MRSRTLQSFLATGLGLLWLAPGTALAAIDKNASKVACKEYVSKAIHDRCCAQEHGKCVSDNCSSASGIGCDLHTLDDCQVQRNRCEGKADSAKPGPDGDTLPVLPGKALEPPSDGPPKRSVPLPKSEREAR